MNIDYARMKASCPKLKAALTRAVKTRDPERVKEAEETGLTAAEVWRYEPNGKTRFIHLDTGETKTKEAESVCQRCKRPLGFPVARFCYDCELALWGGEK